MIWPVDVTSKKVEVTLPAPRPGQVILEGKALQKKLKYRKKPSRRASFGSCADCGTRVDFPPASEVEEMTPGRVEYCEKCRLKLEERIRLAKAGLLPELNEVQTRHSARPKGEAKTGKRVRFRGVRSRIVEDEPYRYRISLPRRRGN